MYANKWKVSEQNAKKIETWSFYIVNQEIRISDLKEAVDLNTRVQSQLEENKKGLQVDLHV